MSEYNSVPETKISECSIEIYEALKKEETAILVGRNNSGKSYLLRKLTREMGQGTSYLGPARYYNFNTLSPYGPRVNRKEEKWRQLTQHLRNDNHNIDNSPLNLQQAVAELTDDKREVLFSLLDYMLQTKTQICHTIPNNSMSQKYIRVDDHNISFTSSGFRLVATLLTSLLDDDYSRFLIDEPELGLSPETQGLLADFIFNNEVRSVRVPHLRSIILATHSPVFIDRHCITNNYHIDRINSDITIRQLQTVQDITDLQFRLLGNRFETLYLPSAIVLVEGSTDFDYLERFLTIKFPDMAVSVVRCNGDGRMREVIAIARQMLIDLKKSPYAGRFFAVIDSVHGKGLVDKLIDMGLQPENIVVWDSNGIEHLYPNNLLEYIFGAYDNLKIDGDIVSANGVEKKKSELSAIVCSKLSHDTPVPKELEEKLFSHIETLQP